MRGTERSSTGMQGTERAGDSDREVVCVGSSAKHRVKVGSYTNRQIFNTDSKSAVRSAISGLAVE